MPTLIPAKIIDKHNIYVEDPLDIQEKDIWISIQPRKLHAKEFQGALQLDDPKLIEEIAESDELDI
ncbi:MAG: hypothetical protein ACE5KT_09565 [Methanosarcinales archaeon]